jgi:uncharacterized protein YfaS (alpha-2-macroglobulin family)
MASAVSKRWLAACAGVAAAVGLYAAAFSAETPVGGLSGRVTARDTHQPLAGIRVVVRPRTPDEGADARSVKTDKDGGFAIESLPAGEYEVQPLTSVYHNAPKPVQVLEGKPARLDLDLKPNDPYLSLNIHQHAYLPDQDPRIALNGFRQGNSVRVTLYAIDRVSLLRDYGGNLRSLLSPISSSGGPETLKALKERRFKQLKTWTVDVSKMDAEGVFYTYDQVGALKSGVYLVGAAGAKSSAYGWMMVTDLALVTKSAEGQVVAFAADLKSGKPIAGASLTVFAKGKVIAKGATRANGAAEFHLAQRVENVDAVAVRGESLAFNTLNPFGYGESREYRAHTYTDRPVYRPGQKVRYKGIVRKLERIGYSVPQSRSGTLELQDPDGTTLFTEHVTLGPTGAYAGDFELNPEVRSGSYNLVFKIEGEEHWASFLVASYRKPEWKVDVTPEKRQYVKGEAVPVTVSATYYFGSPVVDGTVSYTVYRTPYWSWWADDDEGYYEPDEEPGDYGDVIAEGEAKTDADGHATFSFSTANEPAEPTVTDSDAKEYQYNIECEVSDVSGRSASGTSKVRVAAGEVSLDARPDRFVAEPNQEVTIKTRVTDLEDKPLEGVQVTLEGVMQEWDGVRTQEKRVAFETKRSDEKGLVEFTVKSVETGLVIARVSAKDKRGNQVGASTDVWISSDTGGDYDTKYPDLSILPDKKQYKVGETAQVLINTDKPGGTALVGVEAERILEWKLVPLKSKSNVIRFPIKTGYEPNVFFSACFVRNREFVTSQARINVNPSSHRINVKIEPQREVYKPRDTATFKVTTTDVNGRPVPAEFSFGLVDEAIYAIREEPKEGLWEIFYPRRQNEVLTQFSYPDIYLGDADKDGAGLQIRRNFQDTAYWEPFEQTGRDGTTTVSVTLPDNLTSWRATVNAIDNDTSIGKATTNIRVMKDLTLRLQTPRSLTEGDRLTLTAVAHNFTQKAMDVTVKIQAQGLKVQGDTTRKIRLDPDEAENIGWEAVAQTPGAASVTASAQAGALSDGMELTVPIRSFTRSKVGFEAGSLNQPTAIEELPKDPTAVGGELEVRVSPTLAGAMLGSLEYLASYPYGCTEQTMSSFLPNVVVMQTMASLGLEQSALKDKLPKMAQAGILRLARYQHYDGGWGWWEYDEDDAWMTAYVVFGLGQAKSAGVPFNQSMLASGISALERLAEDKDLSPDEQMFLAYVLTLNGKTDKAAPLLAKLNDAMVMKRVQVRSLAYAVMALANSGQRDKAQSLLDQLWKRAVRRDGQAIWQEERDPRVWEWTHHGIPSDLESTAMVLKAALQLTPDDPRLPEVVRALLIRRSGNRWDSTRDTAWILFALADYLKESGELKPDYTLTVLVNGKTLHSEQITSANVGRPEITLKVPFADLAASNRVEIRKDGIGVAYYSVSLKQDLKAESFAPESSEPGLTMTREYYLIETKRDAEGRLMIGPAAKPSDRFKVGDRVLVRLKVKAPRPLAYVMVEDPLPPGFEVQERGDVSRDEWDSWWTYTDVRDDRINLFAREVEKGEQIFEYHLRPESESKVRTLPAVLSDMYTPSLRASTSESKLEVRR